MQRLMSDECSSGKIGDKHLFERQDIINNNENIVQLTINFDV